MFKLAEADTSVASAFAKGIDGSIYKVSPNSDYWVMKFKSPADLKLLDRARKHGDYFTFSTEYQRASDYVTRVIREILDRGIASYAQPNFYHYTFYIPDDPYCNRGTGGLRPENPPQQYGQFYMGITEAWEKAMGEKDILIAILDSGIDVDHPDLSLNIWINPGEDINGNGLLYDLDDLDGIDNDGNGYIDDLFGYDFSGGNTGASDDDPDEKDFNPDIHHWGDDGWGEPDPSAGDGLASSAFMPADAGVFHGTHCAGIAAAVANNALGIAGAAPHCRIMAIRLGHAEGSFFSSDIVEAVDYAVTNGASVISMSFGALFGADPAAEEACQFAYENGIPVAAASGNMGSLLGVSSPASCIWTLAVGSCTSTGTTSNFTQTGPELDVLSTGGEANMWTGVVSEGIWSTAVASVAIADSTGMYPV